MNVYVVKNIEQNCWWVHMDQWQVSFNTPNEAEHFFERLTARLNAPHSLDMIADHSAAVCAARCPRTQSCEGGVKCRA